MDEGLRELVGALKHDLGKYVAWISANLEPGVWDGPATVELLDALVSDVLETRRRPGGVEAAWEVWARLRAEISALPGDPLAEPELVRVAAAVERLRLAQSALRERDLEALTCHRASIRGAQTEIRTALRELHRRLR